jgi:serine/threonine-protein kinase
MRKFAARHIGALGTSLAAFAILAGALGATLVANDRAERARVQAEERFQQTRAIANSMLFDVFDEVSLTAGTTTAREMLARTSLTYLEALAADPNAPTDVRVEAGLGFLRLSQVIGGGQTGELGRQADAGALLLKAQSILQPLYEAQPEDPSIARAMVTLLLEQTGAALYADNNATNALALATRAREILEPYRTADAAAARQYITTLQAQADSYGWDDRFAEALPLHQQAETFALALPEAIRTDINVTRARGSNLRLMGEAYHRLGRVEEARTTLALAVTQQRNVVERSPNNTGYQRNLAIALWFSAVVHRTNERNQEAQIAIEESVAIARRMRERDPNDASAVRMVAISSEVYAQVLADLGRFNESYTVGQDVIVAQRELVRRAGNTAGARRSLAAALMTHGGNSYNSASYTRACEAWIEAEGIYEELNRNGAMSEWDRTQALAEAQRYVSLACNPPRAGLAE